MPDSRSQMGWLHMLGCPENKLLLPTAPQGGIPVCRAVSRTVDCLLHMEEKVAQVQDIPLGK